MQELYTSLVYKKRKVFTQNIYNFPGLPNLGVQIRCAQNTYTTGQMVLKYPL